MKERKKPSQSWIGKSIEEIEKEIKMEREEAFCIDWYMVRKMNKTPTFADAIEWADKTMVEKATQWLFENVYDYLNPEDQERVESFRKYLEEKNETK